MDIIEPTQEQCCERAKVYESGNKVGYAMWAPQIGGYCGKCVVVVDKEWEDSDTGSIGGCFDTYLWHDGEFPTPGKPPAVLHFCDPQQVIDFGQSIKELNDLGKCEG